MVSQIQVEGMEQQATIASKVIDILEEITGTDQVRQDLDLALFDLHLLDSLGLAEAILSFSETFGLEISPAEIERQEWATPRKIIAFVQQRIDR